MRLCCVNAMIRYAIAQTLTMQLKPDLHVHMLLFALHIRCTGLSQLYY